MDKTVKDWEIELLQLGAPMNRKVRRAANKKGRVALNKLRRKAIEGDKVAQSNYVATVRAMQRAIDEC